MKTRLFIIILVSILIGILIACLAYYRQFYYVLFLLIAAMLTFALKRGKVTVYDWLFLFILTMPVHSLRLGGQVHFVRLTEIIFMPLFLFWLIDRSWYRRRALKMHKEFFMILGFWIINILAISKSMYPVISIMRVLIISYLIIFCYLVSDILRTRQRIMFITQAMIVISALSAILAILQVFIPELHIFPKHSLVSLGRITLYRAGAGWEDPNYYALYLVMNAALTLSYLFSRQLKTKGFFRVCLLLQCAGIVATFSRMGFICLFFVFVYSLFAYRKLKIAICILLIAIVVIAGLVGSIEYIYDHSPFVQAYVFRHPDLEMLQRYPQLILVYRWDAFCANWRMFIDNPFLGVGPFMAMYNYSKYVPADALWSNKEIFDTHNQYLQLLSEKGIFGFIFFMGFIILIWQRLTRLIVRYQDDQIHCVLIGLKGSMFAYLVASLVTQTTHEIQFWLSAGLCLALFSILEKKEGPCVG